MRHTKQINALSAVLISVILQTGCTALAIQSGQSDLGQGRYAEALERFQDLHKQSPESQKIQALLANAYRANAADLLGRRDCVLAANHIGHATRLSQKNIADYRALEDCLVNTELELKKRISVLQQLVKDGERHGPILREYAIACLDIGDVPTALKFARLAHKRYALNRLDFSRFGYAFAKRGHPKLATKYLGRHVKVTRSDALARLKLAEQAEKGKQSRLARKTYDELAIDFPNNPVIFVRLADFCKRTQDTNCYYQAKAEADRLRGTGIKRRDLRPLQRSRY
ncbi:MAG: hypothetical protein CMH52_08355 [Myxococcales bacterium]|nr:hypothetical protein [Myxococcales bacterium]